MICLFLSIVLNSIEEDPVWSQADSVAFKAKFLRNDIPEVVNFATLVKSAHSLSVEKAELVERLRNLREDRRQNNNLELYRIIQQLRIEVDSLQSRVRELEAIQSRREEEEEAERERARIILAAVCIFDVFSNPARTAWNPATSTLTYSGPIAHNYAVSSVPLPSDRPFQWKVEIVTLPTTWLFLGIIGKAQGIAAKAHYDSRSYCWGHENFVFVAGKHKPGQGGWAGWQQGDRGLFTYNPVERTLSLELERTNTRYTIDNLPSPYTAHVFCSLYYPNTAVRQFLF